MLKIKYTKIITCPVREETYNKIQKMCEKKDIPTSVLIRSALKKYIEEEESKNEK